jgi:glycosyltransferase involved in cell wall biosynthesis
MTILISSASYFYSDRQAGGENRVAAGIVSELSRRGHRLILLAPRVDASGLPPNTEALEVGGYRFDPVRDYLGYRLNWWRFSIRAYVLARRLVRKCRVDIVHHVRPAYLGRFSLCQYLARPFVYGPITPVWENTTSQDRDAPPPNRRLTLAGLATRAVRVWEGLAVPLLWRHTLERAARVLVQIPKAAAGLPDSVGERIRFVGLATDTGRFRPADVEPAQPTVLFLAKLNRRKGLEYLLRAMPSVRATVPGARLVVVGDGPASDRFKSVARSLHLGHSVVFVGSVPHDDTPRRYRAAHVYCLPSVGEPAANTLLEAMASGLPVVATAAGGVPEIVDQEAGGILVRPRDPEALSAAIRRLLLDPDLRQRMGRHNREKSLRQYDVRRLVDRIEAAYAECAAPSARSLPCRP